MGMFDYVNYECDCPECGAKVACFQSKDGGCDLVTLEPDAVLNFYGPCPACALWLEFNVDIPEPRTFTMTTGTSGVAR